MTSVYSFAPNVRTADDITAALPRAVPGREASKPRTHLRTATHVVIADHGSVVQIADAAQPRPGSMILVDPTSCGDPKQLNAGLAYGLLIGVGLAPRRYWLG